MYARASRVVGELCVLVASRAYLVFVHQKRRDPDRFATLTLQIETSVTDEDLCITRTTARSRYVPNSQESELRPGECGFGARQPMASRSASPTSLALDIEERMYELYDRFCRGEIRLEQAFLKLGLGYAPAMSEKALSFAVTSSEAFTDLFNACVDEQAAQFDATPMRRSDSKELNPRGAAHVTVFSGADPDDIHHDHFQNASDGQSMSFINARSRRPSTDQVQVIEGLSIDPSKDKKVRRERRLSVDADRLLCTDALTEGAVTSNELGGATSATRGKELQCSTDRFILDGVRRPAPPSKAFGAPPEGP